MFVRLSSVSLASGRFWHDVDFDGFAKRNSSLYRSLGRWEAVDAVTPPQLGRGGEGGRGGAVGQQETHFNLRRL